MHTAALRVAVIAIGLLTVLAACQGPSRREPVLTAFALNDLRLPQPGFAADLPPEALAGREDGHYPVAYALRAWYDRYNAATEPQQRTFCRDRIAFTFLTLIKHYHEGTTDDLYQLTASISTGFDVFAMTAGAIGAVAGGPQEKAVLAALAGLSVGTHASLSKNFLAEQATTAILQQMDAMRLEQEARVRRSLAQPDSKYPLHAALTDLYDYYTAGSVKDAVAQLSRAAQQAKDSARANLDSALRSR